MDGGYSFEAGVADEGKAVLFVAGDVRRLKYTVKDMLHRVGRPAEVSAEARYRVWAEYGMLHREGGPAVEYTNGSRYWYNYDKLHRLGGPAIEAANGDRYWFENDIKLTERRQSSRA